MKSHLLDTNAWLFICEQPEVLSAPVRDVITRSREPFSLSAISVWEVSLKVRKGKLALAVSLEEWLRLTLRPSFVQILPIDADIARAANELPGDLHEDPADRLVVATARLRDLTVITRDEKIRAYAEVKSLW